jgi:hypothetical protein
MGLLSEPSKDVTIRTIIITEARDEQRFKAKK